MVQFGDFGPSQQWVGPMIQSVLKTFYPTSVLVTAWGHPLLLGRPDGDARSSSVWMKVPFHRVLSPSTRR